MATSTRIVLTAEDTGIVKFKTQTEEVARRTSELLQKNHEDFHIFFNSSGFHNHMAHGLLTLYAFGAPVEAIEKNFKCNESYQWPARPVVRQNVEDMHDRQGFVKHLGDPERYHDYLVFFQGKLDKEGVETVLKEYLFADNAFANDMMVRLFAGVYHPLIQLSYGLEFKQPALIAEALAETAVHDANAASTFASLESASRTNATDKSLSTILSEMQADPKLRATVNSKGRGPLTAVALAPEEVIPFASQWTVTPDELQRKTAEMVHTAIYFTMSAQRPPKAIKMDFFLMHCVTSSLFWGSLNALPWLDMETKVKMLKWKGWADLLEYASAGMPALLPEEVEKYAPLAKGADTEWEGVVKRLVAREEEDVHVMKLARAILFGAHVSKEFEGEEWVKFKGDTFRTLGNMTADIIDTPGATWVRRAGFPQAWEAVQDRAQSHKM